MDKEFDKATAFFDDYLDLNDMDDYLGRAGALLQYSCLGRAQVSTNTHGPKTFFFTKRLLSNDMNHYMQYLNIVNAFSIEIPAYKGHTIAILNERRPASAPMATIPDDLIPAQQAAIVANITAMRPAVVAAPVGAAPPVG